MPRHSWPTRVASALFAVVFLWASGPDAYGLHECPEHATVPPAAHTTDAPHGAPHHLDPGSAPSADAPLPGGPCTCIQDCQVTGEPPPPSGPSAAEADALRAADPAPPRFDPRVLGARHAPFELHLPNAPPLLV